MYRQPLQFRHARSSDADAIAALHSLSWQQNYRGILTDEYLDGDVVTDHLKKWRERCEHINHNSQFIWLAIGEDDQLIGLSCALLDNHPEWGTLLDNLHVHPDAMRQGLGRRLMIDTARWVVENRRSQLHLTVLSENHAAVAFYESMNGKSVAHESVVSPDGTTTPVIRYLWDAKTLAES